MWSRIFMSQSHVHEGLLVGTPKVDEANVNTFNFMETFSQWNWALETWAC